MGPMKAPTDMPDDADPESSKTNMEQLFQEKWFFDPDWYCTTYPDVPPSGIDPFEHFATFGALEGRNPHWLFDGAWYADFYPDVAQSGTPAIIHFLRHGRGEGRNPHPLFDHAWYVSHNPDVIANGIDPLYHYICHGQYENRDPHPFFNIQWYLSRYPDVRGSTLTPAAHFYIHGIHEDRSQHPLFDPRWYAITYLVAEQEQAPAVVHFLTVGTQVGTKPHPLWDENWYLTQNPDAYSEGQTGFEHFISSGLGENLSPTPLFDVDWYQKQSSQTSRQTGSAFIDYMTFGFAEGLNPHPLFETDWYRREACINNDVNALTHYALTPAIEEVSPCPMFDISWYRAGNTDLTDQKLFTHFVTHGDVEKRSPHQLFDPIYYCQNSPGVTRPLYHFAAEGWKRKLNPHPMFDTQYFLKLNPDLCEAKYNPLSMYLRGITKEWRHPHPLFDGLQSCTFNSDCRRDGPDSLIEYVQFRSSLDPVLVARGTTGIPHPKRSIIPKKRASRQPISPADPLISVLLTHVSSSTDHLTDAINSVRCQTYSKWELIILDDASTDQQLKPLSHQFEILDQRISVVRISRTEGISAAKNAGLSRARGEFLALLSQKDVLLPFALQLAVDRISETACDVCYSDEASVSGTGRLDGTFYKPDWSPALLASTMYIGHLLLIRRSLLGAAGGWDPRYDGCEDLDLILRVSPKAKRVEHISELLYHQRRTASALAFQSAATGEIEEIQAAAVNAYFERIGFSGRASPNPHIPQRMMITPVPRSQRPAIDVILVGDRSEECIDQFLARLSVISPSKFHFPSVEARGSGAKSGRQTASRSNMGSFSISPWKSCVARYLNGLSEYVLIIDPSLKPTDSSWLDFMLMYVEQTDVFSTSPPLFERSGGCVLSGSAVDQRYGLRPLLSGLRLENHQNAGPLACARETSATHGSAILMRRSLVEHLGGLNGIYGGLYFGVGDIQVRAMRAGYRNISIAVPQFEIDPSFSMNEQSTGIDRIIFTDIHRDDIGRDDRYLTKNTSFIPAVYPISSSILFQLQA